MSKEKQPTGQAGAADPTPSASRWFLPNFMAVSSRAGLRPTVTLNVGGLLVAGELIDAATYFDELAAITNEELQGSISDEALAQLNALFGAFRAQAEQPGGSAGSGPHEPTHIHLRNARVYQPGGTPAPAAGGVAWRVRLDAVLGFSLDREPR